MKDGLKIQSSFDALTNTAFWEQYLLNSFQFSAAKSRSEMKVLQNLVFDENKQKKAFSKFKKDAQKVVTSFNSTWLRAEYELAVSGSVSAEDWKQIWNDRDINPYAIYKTRRDGKVRPEHAEFEGLRFRIDGKEAKQLYAPNGWNCRCFWETTSEPGKLTSESKLKKLKEENIAPEFQNNVGTDGIFPSTKHTYFDVLPNANKANYEMFGSASTERTLLNTTVYDRQAIEKTILEWKSKTGSDNIIFRNRDYLLNINMSSKLLEKLNNKSRGFENIRNTIERPHEIWMKWANAKEQKEVITTFFAHDKKYSYIVEVQNGFVIDAYFRSHLDSKLSRKKGVKLIK